MLKRVVEVMESIAPISLAEAWDNVGVNIYYEIDLETPFPRLDSKKIMLTIDLTDKVLKECISDSSIGVIISYHPPLFNSFKRLTLENEKTRLALICSGSGISVYSPHTCLDNKQDGINDWLAFGLGKYTRIQYEMSGGLFIELEEPIELNAFISHVKKRLGLSKLRVGETESGKMIKKIGICAGSGASVLLKHHADVYWTGEMGHHEVLEAVSKGTNVVLCEHSNTERGYLFDVLRELLEKEFKEDGYSVVCSSVDKDPLMIM